MSLRVGQIGAGGISRPHLHEFVRSRHVSEVYLADPGDEAREALSREFGIIKRSVADYREILGEVDVVDICTPHYLHHPIATEALRAGKDVILEKPLAMNVEQCDEIIALAAETGRRCFCALCQRMLPAHVKAKQMMDAGAVGKPFLAAVTIIGNEFARMNDPGSWKGDWERAGGGALFDTGYHAVYVLQHLLGRAKTVSAMTKRLIVEPKNKADDTSAVAMEMETGALASIVVTYSATGDRWSEERRIVGTEGSLLIRDDPEDEMPLVHFQGGDFAAVKVHNPPQVNWWAIGKTVDHFLTCIVEDKKSEVTLAEARDAVATVQAAYRSEREGRRVEV
jgi:UDP-N-acetylglucosamine 3-dehydrogenase